MSKLKMSLKLGTLAIGAFLSLSQAALATDKASCTNVDLRSEMGPIRDQGDIGWCYANAAADLMSFKLRDQLKGKQVSAAYTALNYLYAFNFRSNLDGGLVSAAVITSDMMGLCSRATEDQVLQNVGLKHLSLNERIDALNAFKADYDLWVEDNDQAAGKRFMSRLREYVATKSIVALLGQKILTNLLSNSTQKSFIRNLAETVCSGQMSYSHEKLSPVFDTKLMSTPFEIPGKYAKYIPGRDTSAIHIGPIAWNPLARYKDFVATVNEQLSNKNIIAIDYFARFLKTDYLAHPFTERDGKHASVVVGRRWNDTSKSCEYLIRNSWGSGCYYKVQKDYCEAGHIWVPEKTLRYNIFAYTYIP